MISTGTSTNKPLSAIGTSNSRVIKLASQAQDKKFNPHTASDKVIGCVYKLVYRNFVVNLITSKDEFGDECYTITTKSITGTSIYKKYYSLDVAILAAKQQFYRYGNPIAEGKV